MDFGFKSKYGWLTAKFGKYPNGRVGIQLLQDGFPFAKMSANLPDVELHEREFHLDMEQCYPIIKDIMDCGHFEDMNREDQSGFKTFSVYKIKDHVPIDVVQQGVMIDPKNNYEMEIASHFIHLAICNLAWNRDFIKTVEVPYSENEIGDILLNMKIRFVRHKYNSVLDVVEVYLIPHGIPTTYLSTIHGWINTGIFNDNFQWVAKPKYDFQSVYEINVKKTRTKYCFDMFTNQYCTFGFFVV